MVRYCLTEILLQPIFSRFSASLIGVSALRDHRIETFNLFLCEYFGGKGNQLIGIVISGSCRG